MHTAPSVPGAAVSLLPDAFGGERCILECVSYLSNAVRGDLDLKHGISIIILTHVVYKQYMDKFLLANPRPKRNDNSLIICTHSVHAESPVHRCFAFLDSIDVCLAVRERQHRRS